MDRSLGHDTGQRPVTRRLTEYGKNLPLCFCCHSEGSEEVHNLQALEQKSVAKVTLKKLKCNKCDFVTDNERGLKIHDKRKHTKIVQSPPDYPQLCEICDEELADVKKMKRHMKSHSYIRIKFKCEDCDFVGENDYSMDVHIGKAHSNDYECGLCDLKLETSEKLEIHLFTCEIFPCDG